MLEAKISLFIALLSSLCLKIILLRVDPDRNVLFNLSL